MSKRIALGAGGLLLLLAAIWWWRGAETGSAAEKGEEAATKDTLAARKAARAKRANDRRPATAAGQITDGEGRPVPGALVELRGMSLESVTTALSAAGERFRSVSDADGRYQIGGLKSGTYSVSASAKGYSPALRKGIVLDPGEDKDGLDLALASGGYPLTGTVSDIGGGPVAGALVRVTPLFEGSITDMFFLSFNTLTDENGRYEIYLKNGSYQLSAQHSFYTRKESGVRIVDGPASKDFVLVPGAVLRGRVLTAGSREPVADALVIDVAKAGGFTLGIPTDNSAITDGEGRFELRGLHPRAYSLSATAKGFGTVSPVEVTVGVAEEVEDIEILVDKARTISGFVVNRGDTEKSVSGAMVGAYNLRPGALLAARKRTESDGYFEIHGVPPGRYNVGVLADGQVPTMTGATVTVEDSDVSDVLVEIDAGVTVRGRVEPGVSARVSAEVEISGMLDVFAAITRALVNGRADDRGEFELSGVPSGKLKLVAMADDGRTGEIEIDVGSDDMEGVVIPLAPQPYIAGRVVDDAGNPVSDVTLRAELKDQKSFRLNINTMMGRMGQPVAPDGSFKLVGLEEGRYELHVRSTVGELALADGKDSLVVNVGETGKDNVLLQVEGRRGVIRGVVRGPRGPVADAYVRVTGQGSWRPQPALTTSDGRFEVSGLAKGKYSVRVEGPKGMGFAEKEGVTVGADLTLEIEAYANLEGVVASQAALSNCSAYADGPSDKRARVAGKKFRFSRLDAGSYTVSVTCERSFGRQKVELEAGVPAEVSVAMGTYSTLRGRVVDDSGEPVVGASFFVDSDVRSGAEMEQGLELMTGGGPKTDAEGRFQIPRVRPGKGHIMVMRNGFSDMSREEYEVDVGETKDLGDIKLDKKKEKDADDDEEDGPELIDLGLELEIRKDDEGERRLFVIGIREATPADGKLEVGDEIVSISGAGITVPETDQNATMLKAMLEQRWPVGGDVLSFDLAIRRGGSVSSVTLDLSAAQP